MFPKLVDRLINLEPVDCIGSVKPPRIGADFFILDFLLMGLRLGFLAIKSGAVDY